MALQHKFDPTHWAASQAKREEVKNNPGNEQSLPELKTRVENVEKAIGLKSTN